MFCFSIRVGYNCKSKYITRNQKNLTMDRKNLLSYNATTNKPNDNEPFISILLTENVYNSKKEYTNKKNNNNI